MAVEMITNKIPWGDFCIQFAKASRKEEQKRLNALIFKAKDKFMKSPLLLDEPWKSFVELCFEMSSIDMPPYNKLINILENNTSNRFEK